MRAKSTFLHFRHVFALAILACSLAVGCTKSLPPPTPQEAHLKSLAVCFGKYLSQHQGNPPKSEAEFKAFIQKIPAAQLPGSDADIEGLFVSPRDSQPYVVRYDLDRSQMTPGPNMPIVAYEQTGVGGKRYTADMVGRVEEVEESRFQELVPASSSGTN